ncbi:sugar ABC transporter permease [Paenibacillus psychroresistens]|uniref:Sugar ABC transporter permease n=1 Tax=Paenibacillus psychroresistens TaxID=1778678 RepID=A0A6B8RFH6_9BACL|nr:ABC transporter permease subunit [Paenibacillus psychroresistens]QGQ94283.1 sugar ABC transporter permease [Paenibacillus psychroresistens]
MTRLKKIKANWELYLLIAPVVAYFIIFHYWPIYGVQIAFKDFSATKGIAGSPWVEFKHFTRFFESIFFDRVIRNTIGISLYSLAVTFPLPIILALMMNEVKNKLFKKAVQNISYAPYFISQVVLVGIVILFLSPEAGVINRVIEFFGGEAKLFMADTAWFKSIFVFSGLWQGLGWGTVIYMAVLAGVDPHLIEASIVDGANKWQRIRHISIPTLIPTAIVLLILAAGNVMNVGFEKVFLLQNPQNLDSSDVIATYIYRTGLLNSQYSFAAAIGLFNSVINCTILVVVNAVARRYSSNSLW